MGFMTMLRDNTVSSVLLTMALFGMAAIVAMFILGRGFHFTESTVIPFGRRQFRKVRKSVSRRFTRRKGPMYVVSSSSLAHLSLFKRVLRTFH